MGATVIDFRPPNFVSKPLQSNVEHDLNLMYLPKVEQHRVPRYEDSSRCGPDKGRLGSEGCDQMTILSTSQKIGKSQPGNGTGNPPTWIIGAPLIPTA